MAMSIKSVVAEAIKITIKNPKLVFLVVALKTLILHSVAYLDVLSLLLSMSKRATAKLEAFQLLAGGADLDGSKALVVPSSLLVDDTKYEVIMIWVLLHAALYVTLNLLADVIAAAHAAHTARLGGRSTCGGLASATAGAWRRALLTDLLARALVVLAIVGVALCLMVLCTPVVLQVLARVAPAFLLVLCIPVVFVAALCLMFELVLVHGLARVVSVVVEGCYGFAAVGKAWKNLRGRRVQGFLLYMISTCLCFALSISGKKSERGTSSQKGWCCERAMLLSMELVDASVAWFSGLIVTVFFVDCSISSDHGDDGGETPTKKML